jgi:hypothetical protein
MMHCVWFSKGNALPDVDVGTPRSSFDRLSNQLVSHGDAVVSEPIGTMPIQPLLDAEGAAFDPDDIKAITAAYEIALKRLDLVDRKAATAVLVAKATIQIAKDGERDPKRLSERVVHALSRLV